ncbi:MAG: hypothetical protein RRZ24_10405 [Clostridia bacterium]
MKNSDKESVYTPDEADLADAISELSAKSEAELFDVLRATTDQERAAGNMDNTRMDEIYQKLSPMLTDTQRKKMQQVLDRLKE